MTPRDLYTAFFVQSEVEVGEPRQLEHSVHLEVRKRGLPHIRTFRVPPGWWECLAWERGGKRAWRAFGPTADKAEHKARCRLQAQIDRERMPWE